jgi:transposase
MFERLAIDILTATQVQAKAADILRLSAGQVHTIMKHAVKRGLLKRNSADVIQHLSLDEKSFKSNHQYVTVLGDVDRGRVLEVSESRTQASTEELLTSTLTPSQRKAVKSVCMDMWAAFMNAGSSILPEADIVHDRFHVAKYLNNAVDLTRKGENRKLCNSNDKTLVRSKYLWLKSSKNLTKKQAEEIDRLKVFELATSHAWAAKESFRSFFEASSIGEAYDFFIDWYRGVQALKNRHVSKVADMLEKHLDGLLAYIKHHQTNAFAEATNGQIQRIKANARGFRKFKNFRIAILFFLGKLDLYPHKIS